MVSDHPTIKITSSLLVSVDIAAQYAKEIGRIIYVCHTDSDDDLLITYKRPINRKEIIAKFWPGGRRQFMWPLEKQHEH